MEPDSPAARVERTLWDFWYYITGAVSRFLRAEPVDGAGDDLNPPCDPAVEAGDYDGVEEEPGVGELEEKRLPAADSGLSGSTPAFWNTSTADISFGEGLDSQARTVRSDESSASEAADEKEVEEILAGAGWSTVEDAQTKQRQEEKKDLTVNIRANAGSVNFAEEAEETTEKANAEEEEMPEKGQSKPNDAIRNIPEREEDGEMTIEAVKEVQYVSGPEDVGPHLTPGGEGDASTDEYGGVNKYDSGNLRASESIHRSGEDLAARAGQAEDRSPGCGELSALGGDVVTSSDSTLTRGQTRDGPDSRDLQGRARPGEEAGGEPVDARNKLPTPQSPEEEPPVGSTPEEDGFHDAATGRLAGSPPLTDVNTATDTEAQTEIRETTNVNEVKRNERVKSWGAMEDGGPDPDGDPEDDVERIRTTDVSTVNRGGPEEEEEQEPNAEEREETQEAVPDYNNTSGAEENTTQWFLESGGTGESWTTQLPEEEESEEPESLKNSDCFLEVRHSEERQDGRPATTETGGEICDAFTDAGMKSVTGAEPQAEEPGAEPGVQGSGIIFAHELVDASVKTGTGLLDEEPSDIESEETEEQKEESGELVGLEMGEGLWCLKEAAASTCVAAGAVAAVPHDAEVLDLTQTSFHDDLVNALDPEQDSSGASSLPEDFPDSEFLSGETEPELLVESTVDLRDHGTDMEEARFGFENRLLPDEVHPRPDRAADVSLTPTETELETQFQVKDTMTEIPKGDIWTDAGAAEDLTTAGYEMESPEQTQRHQSDDRCMEEKDEETTGQRDVIGEDLLDLWIQTAQPEEGLSVTQEEALEEQDETESLCSAEDADVSSPARTASLYDGEGTDAEDQPLEINASSINATDGEASAVLSEQGVTRTDAVDGFQERSSDEPTAEWLKQTETAPVPRKAEVDGFALDFSAQRARIAVKNPHVRPPKDPRTLLHKPSVDPVAASPHGPGKAFAAVPLGGLGIGIKLPGLGGGIPVLKRTQRAETESRDPESTRQAAETTSEEEGDTPAQEEAVKAPRWLPPRHPGFGNPLMSELKHKLKKTSKD